MHQAQNTRPTTTNATTNNNSARPPPTTNLPTTKGAVDTDNRVAILFTPMQHSAYLAFLAVQEKEARNITINNSQLADADDQSRSNDNELKSTYDSHNFLNSFVDQFHRYSSFDSHHELIQCALWRHEHPERCTKNSCITGISMLTSTPSTNKVTKKDMEIFDMNEIIIAGAPQIFHKNFFSSFL
jgi:hypothetical protein